MQNVLSIIYNIFFVLWTSFIVLPTYPLIMLYSKSSLPIGRFWAWGLIKGLKIICGIDLIVKGRENLPKEGPFIIASKHQSTLETIAFLILFKNPIFVLKQQLTYIPFYGAFFKQMKMIYIDRKGGAKTLKDLIKQVKSSIITNRPIIIFPEGTRVNIDEKKPYQPGIMAIYNLNLAPIIPTALNSGAFWPRGLLGKKPGNCIIEFLPPIEKNLSKEIFINKLENEIETRSKNLLSTK